MENRIVGQPAGKAERHGLCQIAQPRMWLALSSGYQLGSQILAYLVFHPQQSAQTTLYVGKLGRETPRAVVDVSVMEHFFQQYSQEQPAGLDISRMPVFGEQAGGLHHRSHENNHVSLKAGEEGKVDALLAFEVIVEVARTDAQFQRDVGSSDPGLSPLVKQLPGRVQNIFGGFHAVIVHQVMP